ncbi:cupin domain-containing protein [Ciceribacter sp. L1K23]|uniref:cupin domain-containing protein n=1 Tax=Ciceribacter sp. L1K23 TaxID=2820276 RepID=UPI001B81F1C7|nr:cupin domain-containing protein [Ciceribacter sp. L1K23]MBR0555135.1 cupin domain-containing protein [Ciceribacter sp. L1K23]
MQTALVPADTRITNHFNKETFVFTHPYDDQPVSRMDVILEAGGSGGGNAIAHVHPRTDEIFTVHYGRLMVSLDGVEHYVEAGQSATVPMGVPHFFRNAFDGETRATVTFTNPQQHQRFFLNLALWTENHPTYFSNNGEVKLLAMALGLHEFRDHLYVASLPVRMQKILFAGLSVVARLAGYRLAVRPREVEKSETSRLVGVPAE